MVDGGSKVWCAKLWAEPRFRVRGTGLEHSTGFRAYAIVAEALAHNHVCRDYRSSSSIPSSDTVLGVCAENAFICIRVER